MKKPCAEPGCASLTDAGRCEAHRIERERFRGSASSRGYGRRWQRFRTVFLSDHFLCEDCPPNHPRPATEVHHVKKLRDFPELKYAEENCMALCHDCHSKRTMRGEGAIGIGVGYIESLQLWRV